MNHKPIFDAVRSIAGRRFKRNDIVRLDRAIECAAGQASSCAPVTPTEIGPEGTALIKSFEGCARQRTDGLVEAYPDPGTGSAPWTIGWGATGAGIGPQTIWTRQECDQRLQSDLARYALDVASELGTSPTTQQQFDALVSFHYNTGAIARATLTRLHKQGAFSAAQAEFARWNRAGGRVLKGLVRRRAAEARLYAQGA